MSAATVTVIDRSRGLTPRAFDRPGTGDNNPAIKAKLAQLLAAAEGRDAQGILEFALKGESAGKTAVVSSFGSESAVLLHLVAQIDPNTPILFLNTGKLFGETLRYRDRLQDCSDSAICVRFRTAPQSAPRAILKARYGRATPMPAANFARSSR